MQRTHFEMNVCPLVNERHECLKQLTTTVPIKCLVSDGKQNKFPDNGLTTVNFEEQIF